MKLFIVDNDLNSTAPFQSALQEKNWSFYSFTPQKTTVDGEESVTDNATLRNFLKDIYSQRPDVVVLDAALTTKEEKFLDGLDMNARGELSKEDKDLINKLIDKKDLTVEDKTQFEYLGTEGKEKKITEETLSGFLYCSVLDREHLGIPIVFFTKYPYGKVARIAMRVGADRVLDKHDNTSELIKEIEELVKFKIPHDSSFYWPMRDNLDSSRDMWKAEDLRKALDRFFLNASSVRRFGLFTASLRNVLSPLFHGDLEVEKKLMLGLVKSQVLLSLVDPQLRDHVKHTGNVFWMGYHLLHKVNEFSEPHMLPGYNPKLYISPDSMAPSEQLLYAWTLAALFHDYGYVDERKSQLKGLIASLVPDLNLSDTDIRSESTWSSNMGLLKSFVSDLLGHTHFLYHFIDTIITSFGSDMERIDGNTAKRTRLCDHGILSAHRLLNMVPYKKLDDQMKNIVLHAALAVACHNQAEMMRKWKFEEKCNGSLEIGMFPVCSLLAFCDSIQTWDRELDMDPVLKHTEKHDGLLERLVMSDTAYISGSEICDFSTSRLNNTSCYDINIRLRYFVEPYGNAMEVCDALGDNIKSWIDSGRLKDVCKITGMSALFHGKIVYELPMLVGSRQVTF